MHHLLAMVLAVIMGFAAVSASADELLDATSSDQVLPEENNLQAEAVNLAIENEQAVIDAVNPVQVVQPPVIETRSEYTVLSESETDSSYTSTTRVDAVTYTDGVETARAEKATITRIKNYSVTAGGVKWLSSEITTVSYADGTVDKMEKTYHSADQLASEKRTVILTDPKNKGVILSSQSMAIHYNKIGGGIAMIVFERPSGALQVVKPGDEWYQSALMEASAFIQGFNPNP